jgi:hypothetical protein
MFPKYLSAHKIVSTNSNFDTTAAKGQLHVAHELLNSREENIVRLERAMHRMVKT